MSPEEARRTDVHHHSKTPNTTARSSQDHKPPLFSQLPKVDAIAEKHSISVSTATARGNFPMHGKVKIPANSLLETAAEGKEILQSPLAPELSLPPEVPLPTPKPTLTPAVSVPSKVSQVSKLLNAISTWVSHPLDRSWREDRDIRTESDTTKGSCATRDPCGDSQSADTTQGSCDTRDPCGDLQSADTTQGSCDTRDPCGDSQSADNATAPDGFCGEGSECPEEVCVKGDSGGESHTVSHDRGGSTVSCDGENPAVSHDRGDGTVSCDGEASHEVSHEAESVVFLPPVDSVSVSRIQRSLFNSQLRQHLQGVCATLNQGVCATLNLSFHHVLPQVSKTTSQFRYVQLL